MRLLLPVLLVLAAVAPASAVASPRYEVDGPRTVRIGERVSFTVTGAKPGERLDVSLAPTLNRGGTCCGIAVRGAQANADGVAKLRFRWPRTYYNGPDRIRWKPGSKADVIVFGDEGRGIKVVRVKRR